MNPVPFNELPQWKKIAAIIIILLTVGGCLYVFTYRAHASGRHAPTHVEATVTPGPLTSPSVTPSVTPSPLVSHDASQGGHMTFKFMEGTPLERTQLAAAEVKANEVVQSQCFEHTMLTWGLIWTKGKTAAAVVKDLRTATKVVGVHYYYKNDSTVGYTYPDEPDTYFNRRFHVFYDLCERASNAAHEYSHKLGYDHPYKATSDRGRTVPYSINHAFEECCE